MKRHITLGLVVGTLLTGCAQPPSIVVFGASFPDWLFCITGGVIATSVVHAVRAGGRRLAWLAPVGASYPILTALFALLTWLIFFPR